MNSREHIVVRWMFCLLLSWSSPTLARDCAARYPAPETLAQTFDMAMQVEQTLNALSPQADIVLLARGGQDLNRFGLTYSHLAFALRQDNGPWVVLHELNRCGSGASDLYREGLADFVGDSVLRAGVLIAVPEPALQTKLKQWLGEGTPASALHEARYSVVAYPFSTQYQNSNQWILEVLAAAAMQQPASNRSQVQSWLRRNGYRPSTLHIKLHERLGARFGVDNAATVDHPASERISGDYSVVTVDSVVDFMKAKQWLTQSFEVPRNEAATNGSKEKRK